VKYSLILLLLSLIVLGGCKRDVSLVPADRIYTVEEYLAQPKLRQRINAVCSNDPGRTGQDPNCINVNRADRIASAGSVGSTPRVVP